ncbi:protein arginine kinase [Calidifontibacillus erzurumensis]|uniref:Protein-arginine kinase n=1 Tax=Calidifontibacillus erzurumensis TaxID=2741433 RepID=A0A8J8GIZ6_9BACI|nr:protein arginine kinase [Calidifontibacillus erzurumensis]NSL52621.1 protein arginine kinase [Calidifontibacillus erzurumensis]
MSVHRFINRALSPWMMMEGPDHDIVLSSRIRLARNLKDIVFPTLASGEDLQKVLQLINDSIQNQRFGSIGSFEMIKMNDLEVIEKRVLVEKHLISPHLAEVSERGAVVLSENEEVSIMVNEEDHIRIQCLTPGLQLSQALQIANAIDDWLEERIDFAFDEKRGYLTSCPTNVGTGLRASVMVHLPALILTNQMNRIIPAINQLGLVVRGIYGEGSQAQGNIFQISNQITLGMSEQDIVKDLESVVSQVIAQERNAREMLVKTSAIQLEDKVWRSYGQLAHSRIISSSEASQCISDVRLGIDLGFIRNIPRSILSELMILTQPGFLQQYAGKKLTPEERDVRRATLIRERLKLEKDSMGE